MIATGSLQDNGLPISDSMQQASLLG
jgi:hypothetical protein